MRENGKNIDVWKDWENWATSPDAQDPIDTFLRYKEVLALNDEDLVGKTILDVGSAEAGFGKYVQENFHDAKVTSIDKNLSFGISAQMRAEKLAFKPESFDLVLVLGVPMETEKLKQTILRYLEVLRNGGEIRIGVIRPAHKPEWEELDSILKDLLSQELIDLELVQLGNEDAYCIIIKKLK